MQSRATRRHLSGWEIFWTVVEGHFAIAVPGFCLMVTGILFEFSGWNRDLQGASYWWFAAIEVVVYGVWLASRSRLSPRTSSLFAGALGAGCLVAATIAVSTLIDVRRDFWSSPVSFAIALIALSIPLGTCVAFGRATLRAWRDATVDPSFLPWVPAIAVALPLLASCYFFAASERLAIAWSIARVERGDPEAVEDAAIVLRCTPWADTTPIFWEWEMQQWNGRDATAIGQLYERVTGWTPESRQESRRYQ